MTPQPRFRYYLAHETQSVTDRHVLWGSPLPLNRYGDSSSQPREIRYGDYFNAARRFLKKNNFNILLSSLVDCAEGFSPNDIEDIQIYLEKHGEFYHPARIQVCVDGRSVHRVLNVAVSAAGTQYIQREYNILENLSARYPTGFTPHVYGIDSVESDNMTFWMFLGEWFEDYHEFHVTQQPDEEQRILVWDPITGAYALTRKEQKSLYRNIARILTYYYNPLTFERISAWHHAAGDFVIRRSNQQVEVKLITVRSYSSPVQTQDSPDLQSVMDAMLVFFLTLSIQTRLDRVDGVHDLTWSHDAVVPETVWGFFESMALKPQIPSVAVPLTDCFQYYLSACSFSDLLDLAHHILGAYPPGSSEVSVIQSHLEDHIQEVIQAAADYAGT